MIDPSLLPVIPGTTPLDAPTPAGLVRERLRREGVVWADEDELPPRRFPHVSVRAALDTPPPVRFRAQASPPHVPVLSTEVTHDNVRSAFTFGEVEPAFQVGGVGDYGWAPRRPDQDLFYDLDGTLRPAEPRTSAPGQRAAVVWVAASIGMFGILVLTAWMSA